MSEDPAIAAREAGLRYILDGAPGIQRQRAGRGWRYLDTDGGTVNDGATLARIRDLAIPPAWTDVWINPHPRGHLQATGRDARGRKQYRYHPQWRAVRDETKFGRLVAFGEALPALRRQVAGDLAHPGLCREKVLASVVRLLEESLIRVGNVAYAEENGSYGLTTMQSDHVAVAGETIHFIFPGKSGITHEIDVRDRRLARIIRRLHELPGQHLFQYLDEEGEPRAIDSEDVNAYLREAAGEDFTAKDVRTWAGTTLAARALRDLGPGETEAARKANIVAAVDAVAERLGNTRAVCRSAYIHPAILQAYEADGLCAFRPNGRGHPLLDPDERWVLAYLREHAAPG
jgi:DNA topoisomerase-1